MSVFSTSGATLVYSTYLGGSGDDSGFGITADGGSSAYLTGSTKSSNFPASGGALDTTFNGDRTRSSPS